MKRQFAKNITSNWAVYAVAAVISFFLTPYIIGKLGQEAYGVWVLVGSFSGYLGLFDFGIGFAVVRFVARYQETGETEKRNEVVSTAFYLALGLALLVVVATVLLMVFAVDWFSIPAQMAGQARAVIFLVGLSIAVGFPLSVFSEALAGGLWRFDLFNAISLAAVLLRVGITVLLLEIGWGLTGLGVAALSTSLLAYLWRARRLYRLLPDLRVSRHLVRLRVLRSVGDYSFFSFLLVFSGRIAFYSDSFIVGYFLGVAEVALFGIAVKIVEYLRQLVFTLTRLFSPLASRLDPDTETSRLRHVFYTGSRLNLLFTLPLATALFFWGGKLITLWVGDAFVSSTSILRVLLCGHLISFTQAVSGEMLLGVGRHRVYAVVSMIAALVNIGLSIILIEYLGLIGVAWGTTIPLAAVSLFYLPFAGLRLVRSSVTSFLKEAIGPALAASVLPAFVIILTAPQVVSVPGALLYGGLAGIVYLPAAWYIGLTRAERAQLVSTLGIKKS